MPLLIFLLLFSSPLRAQNFTVEGDRIPLPLDRSSSNAVVLNKEDLVGKSTLNEALQGVSGLSMAENGPYGGTTTYFLRGFGRGGVKVFIDGVEIVDPSDIDRGLQLQHFPITGVEKIEVIKGAQGALYGADASGGVILITTSKTDRSNVRASLSTHETWSGGFQTQATQSTWRLRASGDVYSTEGISAFNEKRVIGPAEKDFYKRSALGVEIEHRPSKTSLSIRGISAKQDIDNSFTGDVVNNDLSTYDHMIYQLKNEQAFLDGEWKLKSNIAHTKVTRDVQGDRFVGQTNQGHVEASWFATQNNAVLFFSDYTIDKVDTSSEFKNKQQENISLGASHHVSFGKFFSDQSLRLDKAQAFASRLTGRLGFGHNLNKNITNKIQLATGFKSPTLYQRYTSFGGNQDLAATKIRSAQASTLLQLEKQMFQLAAFVNDSKNLIDYDLASSRYINIGETKTYGLEWESRHKISNVTLSTAYTWMRARNEITKADLPRRPRWFGRLGVDYRLSDAFSFRASHQAVSRRNDSGKLPYYDVVGLGSTWQRDHVSALDLDLANVFDREYESVRTYGTLGRTVRLQLRWQL